MVSLTIQLNEIWTKTRNYIFKKGWQLYRDYYLVDVDNIKSFSSDEVLIERTAKNKVWLSSRKVSLKNN